MNIEIMAPVGCYESLAAAIQAGAGSVYFGIQGLNMRSGSANNFTIDDLPKIAEICRRGQMPEDYVSPQEVLYPETTRQPNKAGHPLKSYLTVNTIIYGEDLEKMRQIIDAASSAGISAIIASDIAAMSYARGLDRDPSGKTPRIEVHLSTQLNISNVEALRFYAQFADVVVLARELNMEQVREIHEAILREKITGPAGQLVRIEMFAHGALCMAVSGKCYMSLHEYNRSANRGACAQVCRHGYNASIVNSNDQRSNSNDQKSNIKDQGLNSKDQISNSKEDKYLLDDIDHDIQLEIDNKYIMSPKDLKTIHFLNKMMDAGVEVYKIEGRARGPEYVKTVVTCYREAAAAVEALGLTRRHLEGISKEERERREQAYQQLVDKWDEKLSHVFNRGFWNGYYLGQRLGEWSHIYGSKAVEKKIYAAKVVGWFSRIGIGDLQCEATELYKGDHVLIIGPTTGVVDLVLNEIQVDYKVVEKVEKGDRFTIPVIQKIRPSDKMYVLRKE